MTIFLSFDDGPGPSSPALLDVLEAGACRAMFFLLGANLERYPETAVRMAREGHVLGNHTYAHARPGAQTEAALIDGIKKTDALIRHACHEAGVAAPAVIPLRLPYGLVPADPRVHALERVGRLHTDWTLILDDWQRPAPPAEVLFETMRAHLEEQRARGARALICLHDSSRHGEARPATVEAVRMLLDAVPGGGLFDK
ncbi:polysaccharide deacetylase [Bordetella genomosp. 10]|uniref:Polysaccharide deacetylase n=1 Tax=Bordetella genomosp. 10 TaxID=1416804 RepID=A0A261SM17_9BORD|nr:polysaccharide deacetylase family protein [Bordetella genomosp. 10]OZI38205.1 polysaccharide deacetylase [Bordetella genomosp. 10]